MFQPDVFENILRFYYTDAKLIYWRYKFPCIDILTVVPGSAMFVSKFWCNYITEFIYCIRVCPKRDINLFGFTNKDMYVQIHFQVDKEPSQAYHWTEYNYIYIKDSTLYDRLSKFIEKKFEPIKKYRVIVIKYVDYEKNNAWFNTI